MDAKKFEQKNRKVVSAFNIGLQNEYLDARYAREVPTIATATPTRLLVILRLNPMSPGLPAFAVRWDEKKNTIDVDLLQCSAADAELFRSGRSGYQGHRPLTHSTDPRVFKIDIRLPQLKVYEALLTCNVKWALALEARLQMGASISCEVLPGQIQRFVG